jgi:hypothetical protein
MTCTLTKEDGAKIYHALGYVPARNSQLSRLFAPAVMTILALRFCVAARRDEKNGFLFTAAMEWHKAADLSAPVGPIADRCWRNWERIVRLPRHLAQPIDEQSRRNTHSSQPFVPVPAANEPALLVSA